MNSKFPAPDGPSEGGDFGRRLLEVLSAISYRNYINLRNGWFADKNMQRMHPSRNVRSLFDLKRAFLYSSFFRSAYAYIS